MNGREVTRSLSCATELIANHSHSKWELRMKPIQGIMMDLQVT